MKKVFAVFLIIAICVAVGVNVFISDEKEAVAAPIFKDNGKFTYRSLFTDKDAKSEYSYDEVWFEEDAQNFNPDLAKMSLAVAMAAADTTPHSIERLFSDLQFEDEKLTVDYPEPTRDTIGYAIGSKKTGENDLVLCAVRGGNYGAEWADNFNIGTSGNHLGFQLRAEKVEAAIKKYISENKIKKKNLKIWITGFSRGGAITNIVAHNLSKTYGNENVFAYCFECPNAVENPQNEALDKNIFSIINDIDFVTYMAPSGWDMGRYGVTCYLPSKEKSKDYNKKKARMAVEYGKIFLSASGKSDNVNYSGIRYNSPEVGGQAKLIESTFSSIASAMTREEAEKKLFGEVRDIIARYYANGNIGIPVNKLALECVIKIVKSLGGEAIMLFLSAGLSFDEFTSALANSIDSHYPELCLSWMRLAEGITYEDDSTAFITIDESVPAFSDVAEEDYFYEAVKWAQENAVADDIAFGKFEAETECTRAQMVNLIWRSAGCPVAYGKNPYTDINENDYFYDAVLWAAKNEIVKGTSEDTFSPENTVTRGQAVTFLWRWKKPEAESEKLNFEDVAADTYYFEPVLWAAGSGITKGTAENLFSPETLCTRGHIITFLYRCTAQ